MSSVEAVPATDAARLLVEAVRLYAQATDAQGEAPKLGDVTATEAAVAASALLQAADIEVFELGMWQVWGNR
jgi:hypothetical protein